MEQPPLRLPRLCSSKFCLPLVFRLVCRAVKLCAVSCFSEGERVRVPSSTACHGRSRRRPRLRAHALPALLGQAGARQCAPPPRLVCSRGWRRGVRRASLARLIPSVGRGWFDRASMKGGAGQFGHRRPGPLVVRARRLLLQAATARRAFPARLFRAETGARDITSLLPRVCYLQSGIPALLVF